MANWYELIHAIRHLLEAGIILDAEWMCSLFQETFDKFETATWDNDGRLWESAKECLLQLVFADSPTKLFHWFRSLYSKKQPWEFRDIVTALGFSESEDASDFLVEMTETYGKIDRNLYHEWARAITRNPGRRARDFLGRLVELGVDDKPYLTGFTPWETDPLVSGMASLARQNLAFQESLLHRAEKGRSNNSPLLLAILQVFSDEKAALASLALLDRRNVGQVSNVLEAWFCAKEHATDSGTYQIVSRGSPEVRRRLYGMATEGGEKGELALELLARIELWLLEYGKPLDEPYHPAIDAGSSWPEVLAGLHSRGA